MKAKPVPQAPTPVLSGCHPDPSVCRVGDEYVLVTSSFAYWPGLPVHRSTDLVHWQPAGHVLTRPGAVDLEGLDLSDGVWAPTVRYHDGVLYVVFAVARGRQGAGTYLCTATRADGPWSDPVRLDAEGIDPALFFDDDGTCWFTACRDASGPTSEGPGEIWLRELDVERLELIGPEHVLWHGAVRGAWVEGPRIFTHDGRYVLVAAEGGTERNHAVTAATAPAVTGPWTTDPRSPLLTHRHLGSAAGVHNVGHADLVDSPTGETNALVLGVRPVDGVHTLGREVFLVPVAWEPAGPVFAPGTGTLGAVVPSRLRADDDTLPTGPAAGAGDAATVPPVEWVSLRGPVQHAVDGDEVVLRPRPESLAAHGRPGLLGFRQDAHAFRLTAEVDADGLAGTSAGVVALQHQDAFVAMELTGGGAAADHAGGHVAGHPAERAGTMLEVRQQSAGRAHVLARVPVSGTVRLHVRSDGRSYRFGVLVDHRFVELAAVPHRELSTEVVGGFLGVLLGLTARGPLEAPPVTFRQVGYRRLDASDAEPDEATAAPAQPTALFAS